MAAILGVLAAAAAGGFRLALPLLVLLLLHRDQTWDHIPLLGRWSPALVLGILTAGAVWELLAPLHPWGVRLWQPVQVLLSPVVGGLLGMMTAQVMGLPRAMHSLLGLVGGALAWLLQLVQMGWFYRRGRFPTWVILAQDGLCALLALVALQAPKQGGLLALMLVWLALRAAKTWQRQFQQHRRPQGPD